MTIPAGMAAAGAMSDAALAREVAQLRQALGTIADQLNRLNGETKALHPKNHTPEMTKAIAKALSVLGALHAGFSQAPGGGITPNSSLKLLNLQVNSLGVGNPPSGAQSSITLSNGASGTFSFSVVGSSLAPPDVALGLGTSGSRWTNVCAQRHLGSRVNLAWGATPAVDASLGEKFVLAATSNIAAVVGIPANAPGAPLTQMISFEIINNSGGALTTPPAFNAGAGGFKVLSALPAIAAGQRYTIVFRYNPDQVLWIQDGAPSAAA